MSHQFPLALAQGMLKAAAVEDCLCLLAGVSIPWHPGARKRRRKHVNTTRLWSHLNEKVPKLQVTQDLVHYPQALSIRKHRVKLASDVKILRHK